MGRRAPAEGLTALVVFVAVALRAAQALLRWDEVALAYAAYAEPVVDALAAGDARALVASWVGLHPPLYFALLGASELLAPRPVLWLLGSAALSAGAVLLVARSEGWLAGLVLATAPLQVLYAGEVNNYPLAVFAVALVLAAARASWGRLAAAAVFAGWTHVLAAFAGLGAVAWRLLRPRAAGERWRLALAVGLGLAPVGAGALRLARSPATFGQPAGDVLAWIGMVARSLGPEGLFLGAIAVLGLRGRRLATWLPAALALAAALLLGAAAPHQRPYLLLLGPPAAAAVGWAVGRRPGVALLVVAACAVRAVRVGLDIRERAGVVAADLQRPRAVDAALADSRPGDTLWLVAPALLPDDDKRATSPVLWRFKPWEPMPRAFPVPFEYRDWRYGQPRRYRERVVHTSTELDPAAFDHVAGAVLARGAAIWVVLYEHAPAAGLVGRVERALRPYDYDLRTFADSGDRLYRVTGLEGR